MAALPPSALNLDLLQSGSVQLQQQVTVGASLFKTLCCRMAYLSQVLIAISMVFPLHSSPATAARRVRTGATARPGISRPSRLTKHYAIYL